MGDKEVESQSVVGVCIFFFGFWFFVFFVFCLCLFRAALEAYGGSQARGPFGAVAAGLHHSHSNDLYHSS